MSRNRTIDHFYSDRSRVLYSSSFRRLQQKAQVFSLESNASVRTRLTHSLEVSDIGRTLANRIAYRLYKEGNLTSNNIQIVVAIVENACLLHDIGNPPFGHFGEDAIKDWAKNNYKEALPEKMAIDNRLLQSLLNDFREFDGNPQGFRLVTRLHNEYDENSLNLTFATLLCIIKYPRVAGKACENEITKKAGYFQTENDIVKNIYKESKIKMNHRYPFVYIMEAADDIAYCMSDIADGIEKGILTEGKFINEFKKEWLEAYGDVEIPVKFPIDTSMKGFNHDISIPWSKQAMDEAVENFFLMEKEIYEGTAGSLINESTIIGKVFKTIKRVSRKILYTSYDAEKIELTGYAVIEGILKKYSRVLKMNHEYFEKLVRGETLKGFDYERRLFNRIGHRYIKAYEYALRKYDKKEKDYPIYEWWLRTHLIIDHVSGMTDDFALETYQMLEGIKIMS